MSSEQVNYTPDSQITGGLTDEQKILVDNLVTEIKKNPSTSEQNIEESKGEKVVSTPGQKTVIKSGDAYTVFAVLRRNVATGKTDFLRVDGAGSIQDGERIVNLDEIPSQEKGDRKPKKEREPRDKSGRREKKVKNSAESGVYEKIEKKLHKFVNSNFQDKK